MLTDDVAAAVLDSLPSLVAVLGPDGTVTRLNEAWRRSAAAGLAVVPVRPGTSWIAACEAAGRSAEREAGKGREPTRDAAAFRTLAALTRQLLDARRDRARLEISQHTPRGRRWLDIRMRTLGRGRGLIVVVDDVTDRHDRETALRRMATHDPVTGLPNRAAMRELIDSVLNEQASQGAAETTGETTDEEARRGTGVAVLFLDVDAFRRVNQTFGYTVGDETVRAVGQRLASVLGPNDILSRWGGDEFVVLARGITGTEAAALADRLTSALDAPLEVDQHRIRVSASVGIALAGGARPSGKGGDGETADPAGGGAALLDGEGLVALAGQELVQARARAREERRGRRHRRHS